MFCRPPHAHGESLAANIFPVLIVNKILSNEPKFRLNLGPHTRMGGSPGELSEELVT